MKNKAMESSFEEILSKSKLSLKDGKNNAFCNIASACLTSVILKNTHEIVIKTKLSIIFKNRISEFEAFFDRCMICSNICKRA